MKLNAGCGDDAWGDVRIDKDPKARALTHVMDVCCIDFPDDYFRESRCISVLEHVKDWRKAVSELCRVTEGRLIIEVPVFSNVLVTDVFRLLLPTPENIRLFKNRRERAKETFHQFKPQVVKAEIEQHGFNVEYGMVFQIYHSFPSRCWRFLCLKK